MTQPPQNLIPENSNQDLTASGYLVRFYLYSSIAIVVVLGLGLGMGELRCMFGHCHRGVGQSEAKTYVGSINKGQHAYYLEQGKFSESIEAIGIGIETETRDFSYRIVSLMRPAQSWDRLETSSSLQTAAIAVGQSKNPNYSSYVGAIFPATSEERKESEPVTIICKFFDRAGSLIVAVPTLTKAGPQCPEGSDVVL